MAENPTAVRLPRRIYCGDCGHMIWRLLSACTCTISPPCAEVLEHRCKACGALLEIKRGGFVVVTVPGTRRQHGPHIAALHNPT